MRGEVSDKMDVYSFGVVLLEIITSIPAIGKIEKCFCLFDLWRIFNSAGTIFNSLERLLNFLPLVQIMYHQFKSLWFFIFELVIQDLNLAVNSLNSAPVEIILYYKICRTLKEKELNMYNNYVLCVLLVWALYRHC